MKSAFAPVAMIAVICGLASVGCNRPTASTQPVAAGKSRGLELDETPLPKITNYHATFAVVIGIDQYPGGDSGLPSLEFAANDAREIRDVLRDDFGYAENRIRYLSDQIATRQAIHETFEKWLPNQHLEDGDAVLVFFAGHGLTGTNDGYLAAVDSKANDRDGSCIAVSWIRDQLARLPCRHKLVVLDSCYSGSLFEETPQPPSREKSARTRAGAGSRSAESAGDEMPDADNSRNDGNLAYYLNNPAFFGISAGRMTPVADGSGSDRHSVFTTNLLRVLREQANSPRPDHVFGFNELAAQVETYVREAPGSHQIPKSGSLGPGDGEFIFRPTHLRQTPREFGDLTKELLARGRQMSRQFLDQSATSTERERREILRALRSNLDMYLSMAARSNLSGDKAYQQVLDWKGAIFARQQTLCRVRSRPDLLPLFNRLQAASSALANTAFLKPEERDLENWRGTMAERIGRREWLERELMQRCVHSGPEFQTSTVTVAELTHSLPVETVLIDFLDYEFLASGEDNRGHSESERRLAAFVLQSGRPVVEVDLGPTEAIANAITSWRRFVLHPGDAAPSPGAELRRLVWAPLESFVGNARIVLISPDGPLCRLPFAALPGKEPDSYLIESYSFVVVPAAQVAPALLAGKVSPEQNPSMLLVGDVDYADATAHSDLGSRGLKSGDDARMRFPALPGTREEILVVADSFQRRFPNAKLSKLRGKNAMAAAFCQSVNGTSRTYVHLATHGFFRPLDEQSALDWPPELYAALVFAGVNQLPKADANNGFVTALEIEGLDLTGTRLVVLSACDTAIGQTVAGEGTISLERSFELAGARSVVGTLWPIADKASRSLMSNFYENLWNRKLPTLEALREAQLTMLRGGAKFRGGANRGVEFLSDPPTDKNDRLPPYYWGAFELSGDWR